MLMRMRTGSILGGETRRSKVIREQHPHCVSDMFSAHAHIFDVCLCSAHICTYTRYLLLVEPKPAAFFEPNLSLFCGFLRGYNGGKD